MRKIILAALMAAPLCAQNPNPQPNFSTTVAAAAPASWVRFNGSSATNFLDSISGLNFSTSQTIGLQPAAPSALTGYLQLIGKPFPTSGALSQVKLGCPTTPSGTALITIGTLSGSGGVYTYTITDSFTITPTSTCLSVQTFVAGTDFSPRNVTAGEYIGIWQSAAGSSYGQQNDGGPTGSYFVPSSSTPSGTVSGVGFSGSYTLSLQGVVTAPAVTPLQPGFDAQQVNNFSAAIPYNGWIIAPNSSTASYEWSTPTTLYLHINKLNYNRLGTLVLWSKGDITNPSAPYQELFIQMNTGASQLCYVVNASTPGLGGSNNSQLTMCTGTGFDAMPSGFNYDLAITNSGTGWLDAYILWINGIPVSLNGSALPGSFNALFNNGLNPATITITNGGAGYANPTAFTSTGGGAGCTIAGGFNAPGGVITSLAYYTNNSHCTSSPTIVLTSPTGTGATFTTTALTSTVLTPLPEMIGSQAGLSTDSGQAAVDVDEFAYFANALTTAQVENIFYWTQFYQGIVGSNPTNPPVVIFDDDSGDPDNQYALAAAIGMHLRGYIELAGVTSSEGDTQCMQMWEQMLNQAGLSQVPVATSASSYTSYGCNASDINVYNPSVRVPALNTSTAMYRTLFAKNPTRPIYVLLAGIFTGMAEFMQSGADSISSLTGAQLMAQNAANGGAVFLQGLACIATTNYVATPCSATSTGDNSLSSDPAAGQYVLANNGTTPLYFYGGSPANTGPGVQGSRIAKDPLLLYGLSHTFNRQAFDSLPLTGMLTPFFSHGVFLAVSGGTGYANLTPFTSSGGGANCSVSGLMAASGGVPTGFLTNYSTVQDTFSGLGYGCTSLPTISLVGATGSGATITPTLTAVCGTANITLGGTPTVHITSATCSNHYFIPYSTFALSPGGGTSFPMFSTFLNSYIDAPPTGQPRALSH